MGEKCRGGVAALDNVNLFTLVEKIDYISDPANVHIPDGPNLRPFNMARCLTQRMEIVFLLQFQFLCVQMFNLLLLHNA